MLKTIEETRRFEQCVYQIKKEIKEAEKRHKTTKNLLNKYKHQKTKPINFRENKFAKKQERASENLSKSMSQLKISNKDVPTFKNTLKSNLSKSFQISKTEITNQKIKPHSKTSFEEPENKYLKITDIGREASAKTIALYFDRSSEQNKIVWVAVFTSRNGILSTVINFADTEFAQTAFLYSKTHLLIGRTMRAKFLSNFEISLLFQNKVLSVYLNSKFSELDWRKDFENCRAINIDNKQNLTFQNFNKQSLNACEDADRREFAAKNENSNWFSGGFSHSKDNGRNFCCQESGLYRPKTFVDSNIQLAPEIQWTAEIVNRKINEGICKIVSEQLTVL
ncbi:hypothetical protein MHBO_000026 [Bonamia ostreae]|uniref:Uncharacterized protein n=1 Tax=Bonamia ostreae TaxID=126728 RepID=A0ABV2AE21_9EUKA